ncbi:presqualene diphosphate synthase HpnD [Sulfuriflexus sp.]|uniref:presqualene diphosphate synthase HpnD n=1 Tax=Sulfuriflexus sp. TaxID=2015443 RepID=UPI0028CDE25C|nr:presqualene diphosphate synthase HpnD [Sulfuriflexus sp.]MDT8403722.1 presqualene diphosphate synthase HpnD [Sulfuriflexus sp.]
MKPDEYCQERAAASGSSFYYSFLFLPAEKRQAITALYAFCREVDDCVDECSDPVIARQKLDWWRSEIARVFHDQPQHPVGIALHTSLGHFQLNEAYFHAIIDGMLMDITQHHYATFEDLSLYCYRAAGVVGLLAAEIFGYQNAQTLDYARHLGTAFQLTNIIRDVREDAQRARVYLPAENLQQFDLSREDILNARQSVNMWKMLQFQLQRAEGYYEQAFACLPEEDRYTQRSGIIMAAIYRRLLEQIKARPLTVLQQRASLSPLRKFWVAWKTDRNEKRRRQQFVRHNP